MTSSHVPRSESVTVAIIARNEEAAIGRTIRSLSEQTLFDGARRINLVVLANGCTDDTAGCAKAAIDRHLSDKAAETLVVNWEKGGKSRSWNRLVHELAPADTGVFLFVDADIVLADAAVCRDLLTLLEGDPVAVACSGRPTKSVEVKHRKSLLNRLSLRVSEAGRYDRAINGSLYCIETATARQIWLPDETPGEDGFLNAMVRTQGFSRPDNPALVAQASRTTHYYDAPGPLGTVKHERRIIVGTMINIWMFEHFWALASPTPIGPIIRDRNRDDPQWVNAIIEAQLGKRWWVVRKSLLLSRLPRRGDGSWLAYLAKLPLGVVATLFMLATSWRANRVLRRAGAPAYW